MKSPSSEPEDATGEQWPLVVVGAGAAGLCAAIFAARAGVRVLLLESRPQPGAKIRVSGGGRCNVLPSEVSLDDFWTSGSVPALRNVLRSWPLVEVREYFETELAVPLKVEASGKMFPQSNDARDVVRALLEECERCGVFLRGGFRVQALRPCTTEAKMSFGIEGEDGDVVRAQRVVMATGGLSLPRTGSDGAGLEMLGTLGHEIRPTYPALVPLLSDDARLHSLSGLSLPVELGVWEATRLLERRRGDFLFTHRGFSGPVVLDVSRHLAAPRAADESPPSLRVAWRGEGAPDWDALLRAGGPQQVSTVLRGELPRRLVSVLLEVTGVPPEQPLSRLSRQQRGSLVESLTAFRLPVTGTEGYATAEVTAGGVPLSELHLKTLESRRVPGLHLCGELLDVVGRIGGYNFLWAWVSGRRAGEGAARGDGKDRSTQVEQTPTLQ